MKEIIQLIIAALAMGTARADICEWEGDVRIWTAPVSWRIKRDYVQLCSNNSDGHMKWRYVCDSGWGENEAVIACKQLRYVGVRKTNKKDWYWTDEDEVVIDLNCENQNATRFLNCSFNVGMQSCNYVRGLKCEKCNNNSDCVSPGQCGDGRCRCVESCLNGGVCRVGICQCPVGLSGFQCETCNTSCENGGECNRIEWCECKQGYYGDSCESKECLYQCLNEGTCLSNGTCNCTVGYIGQYCENILNESRNISLPTSTEHVITLSNENDFTQTKTPVISIRKEEDTTHILTTNPGLDGIFTQGISSINLYAAGFSMMGVSSGVILVLCCCHFLVIVSFIFMRREKGCMFGRFNPHESFYEPSQTLVSSYYQIPMTHVAQFENIPNTEREKIMEKSGDEEYTEMKLVYDNRDIISEEIIKQINTEVRKKRKVLLLDQSVVCPNEAY